jgi:hypothetical protein
MKQAAALLLTILVLGCAGGARSRPAPDWVFAPPPEDATFMYFTGSGSSAAGDRLKAEETARAALTAEIMRYIGVKVTAETTAVARASVDSYTSDVRQQITESGSGRIAGLALIDSWTETGTSGTTVHLLARYAKADLLKEKRRIEQVFAEQVEAVAGPEREGRDLESAGRLFEAAARYIDAAAAAAGSSLENARIKYDRNLNKARSVLERISLVKLNDNLSTETGAAFPEPLRLKAVAGATADDPGVPEVALVATYKEAVKGGTRTRAASLKTGSDGSAVFVHPVPQFAGPGSVILSIDLSAALAALEKLPKEYRSGAADLEDIASSKRAVFRLEVMSAARSLPTGIAVAALDRDGNPLSGGEFAAGLLDSLSTARFAVSVVGMDPSEIIAGNDDVLIADAAAHVRQGTKRVIYGVARIESTEKDGGMTVVKASGAVKIADLATGEVLLSVKRSRTGLAEEPANAVSSALRKLGEDIGREIANSLR